MGHSSWRLVSAISSVSAAVSALLLLVCILPSRAAAAADIYRFYPGLHISRQHPPTQKQLQLLLKGLRYWTGLTDLGVDADGHFRVDRTRIDQGSATARELLLATIDSQDSFIVEGRDHTPTVAFGQIEPVDDYVEGSGARHVVWQIRIDFSDFTNLSGAESCLASFDPASNMLHELGHGVLKLHDTISPQDQLGDCERYINRMRAELGLPERLHYYPHNRMAVSAESTAQVLQAELTFLSKNKESRDPTILLMRFNVERVCEPKRLTSDYSQAANLTRKP
jgi:hypothetical protein